MQQKKTRLAPNIYQSVENCLVMEVLCKSSRIYEMAGERWIKVRTHLGALPAGEIPCGNRRDTLAFLYAKSLLSFLDETEDMELFTGLLADVRDARARQMNILLHAFLMDDVPEHQYAERRELIRLSIGCLAAYIKAKQEKGTYTDADWRGVRAIAPTFDGYLSDLTGEVDLDRQNPKQTPAFEKNRKRLLYDALTYIEEKEPDGKDPDMASIDAMARRLSLDLLQISSRLNFAMTDISDFPGIRAYQIETDGSFLWPFCLSYASGYFFKLDDKQSRRTEMTQTAKEAVLRALDARIISLYMKEEQTRALAIVDTIHRKKISPTGTIRFRDIQTHGEDVVSAGRLNPNQINRDIRKTSPEVTVTACALSIAMAFQAETFRDSVASLLVPRTDVTRKMDAQSAAAELAEQVRSLSDALAREKEKREEDRESFASERQALGKEIRRLTHLLEEKEKETAYLPGGEDEDASRTPKAAETEAVYHLDLPAPSGREERTEEDEPENLQLDARYVFVCQHDGMTAKLLAAYPNSVRSEEFSITKENADNIRAAVCITKSASHAEYSRVKSQCERLHVPFLNVNVTGLARVEREIARLARESDEKRGKMRSAKTET